MTLGLDRHRMRALLDTGAQSTVVSRKAALDAGADINANDPASSGQGISGKPLDVRVHRFREMTVGDRAFENARVGVIDTPMSTDMLLGMDFLRWRRVWPSYSTGWVFMQLGSGRGEFGVVAARPEPSPAVSLYMPGQLAAISKQDAVSDALPADRLRVFSTHSHITYQVMPRVVEVPRLSPEAHAPASFVPIH
ncbi:retropepsin-like aspartic protease [Caballeronia sp. LZ024]|nr:retropepsin-like aspartic protease [Caballeronia sp. LZ024]MDR5839520.1 retropepsin-like aspartic protease [Caballeronia sp. LZ031]